MARARVWPGAPAGAVGRRAGWRRPLAVGPALTLALAAAAWPAPTLDGAGAAFGRAARRLSSLLPGAAPAAAWSEWCDTDPVLLIRTPRGQLVPIFFLTGVYGERYAVSGLLANLSADYTAEPVAEGTAVEVRVTAPAGGPSSARGSRRACSSPRARKGRWPPTAAPPARAGSRRSCASPWTCPESAAARRQPPASARSTVS
jgi:hypothetical protein